MTTQYHLRSPIQRANWDHRKFLKMQEDRQKKADQTVDGARTAMRRALALNAAIDKYKFFSALLCKAEII